MLLIILEDRWQKQWRATSYGRTHVYVHPRLGSILGKNLSNQFWSTCGYKKTLLTPLSERKGKKFANIWHKWRRMANCGGHNKWQNSMHGTPRLDFQLYIPKKEIYFRSFLLPVPISILSRVSFFWHSLTAYQNWAFCLEIWAGSCIL